MLEASHKADLVTHRGVSVGEEDHVRIALEQLGNLSMWRLNIKPGKPLAFGLVNGAAFMGLPGNGISVRYIQPVCGTGDWPPAGRWSKPRPVHLQPPLMAKPIVVEFARPHREVLPDRAW